MPKLKQVMGLLGLDSRQLPSSSEAIPSPQEDPSSNTSQLLEAFESYSGTPMTTWESTVGKANLSPEQLMSLLSRYWVWARRAQDEAFVPGDVAFIEGHMWELEDIMAFTPPDAPEGAESRDSVTVYNAGNIAALVFKSVLTPDRWLTVDVHALPIQKARVH